MGNNKIILSSQRNYNDIALELTEIYLEKFNSDHLTKEKLGEIYKYFYKTTIEAINRKY